MFRARARRQLSLGSLTTHPIDAYYEQYEVRTVNRREIVLQTVAHEIRAVTRCPRFRANALEPQFEFKPACEALIVPRAADKDGSHAMLSVPMLVSLRGYSRARPARPVEWNRPTRETRRQCLAAVAGSGVARRAGTLGALSGLASSVSPAGACAPLMPGHAGGLQLSMRCGTGAGGRASLLWTTIHERLSSAGRLDLG